MQLAIVNDKRVEAFSGGRGLCPSCGSEMLAKCGSRNIDHWAHHGRRDCDPWWENETQWHRDWKNLFPEECREISHIADDGEIHRADIKTITGIVVEIQHSSMTDAERISRDEFYQNMVWVIDGAVFKDSFDIYHHLPNPESEVAQDLVWSKAKRHKNGSNRGMFFRVSEAKQDDPKATKETVLGGRIHGLSEIKEEVDLAYNGHHQYDWVRPRKTWLESKCPVYIDFGDEYLVKLETYDSTGLKCIRFVAKSKFVHDVMIEHRAEYVATKFYPVGNT